ncbi:MAG: cytochrome c biogenesis protein CcdA [Candidatus Undinarchaeales archaeon]|jgi:cytochrome c-type biogenesis protein|nr:cytochrome c biogenesis protein CcdA [Candidatus Undinarchaeales archaeon]
MAAPSVLIAFAAGLISFLSPCVLPLLPGFIAYLSGTSLGEKLERRKTFLNSVAFVAGFSLVFALVGVLLNTTLKSISYDLQIWLGRLGGLIIIGFALHVLKVLRIGFLQQEYRLTVKHRFSITYITSFVFGAAFAVGWSPCAGAILISVLALSITQPGMAFLLLMAYALGMGLPILLVGAFTNEAVGFINRSEWMLKYFEKVVGLMLLVLGLLVLTNNLNRFASIGIEGLLARLEGL